MPGQKKGRGRHKGIIQASLNPRFVPTTNNPSIATPNGRKGESTNPFSLRDAARNTEHRSWVSTQRLRHHEIHFVESSERNDKIARDQEITASLIPLVDRPYKAQSLPEPTLRVYSPNPQSQRGTQRVCDNPIEAEVCECTSETHTLEGAHPPEPASIQSEADSEKEIIVFAGRNRPNLSPDSNILTEHTTSLAPSRFAPSSMRNTLINRTQDIIDKLPSEHMSHSEIRLKSSESSREVHIDDIRLRQSTNPSTEYEAAIADYAGNVKSYLLLNTKFSSHQHETIGTWERLKPDAAEYSVADHSILRWEGDDLAGFPDSSTSDDARDSSVQIVSKRNKKSGTQYLLMGEGGSGDNSRWIPFSQLTTPEAREVVQSCENATAVDRIATSEHISTGVLSDIEQMAIQDEANDMQEIGSREYILDRAIERMTDGQIARLLSKQEEFGIQSNELTLFDSLDFDLGSSNKAPKAMDANQLEKSSPRKCFQTQESMLLEDVAQGLSLTEPYGGFDMMDFARPSLQRKGKARRGRPPVSDEELDRTLQNAWRNDRAKKKLHKEARGEAQVQGLLGKNGSTSTAGIRREAITASQLKIEIKSFLTSNYQSLSLPPMDKNLRRLVHEIANRLSLRSKSSGVGHQRYPQLYKTSLTETFDEVSVQHLDDLLTWGNRRRRGAPTVRKSFAASCKGRGSEGAAIYKDGEIVGAEAPELGLDNKGRAMLEKMGWSKGTALGASNNKGILQPVSHVVKTTKAGLG